MNLVTLVTENYLDRARPFLKSLEHLNTVERSCICLGFSADSTTRQSYPHVHFHWMPRHWSESSCGIMQHGRWLDALPDVSSDKVYILSDADILVQRGMTLAEESLFRNLAADEFAAGWNAWHGDNLRNEAERIRLSPRAVGLFRGSWRDIPCWNTGVLAMRAISWQRLRGLYESRCERFYKLTEHRSRGQWLMSWCLWRLGLRDVVLPLSTHAHGHFGLPSGVQIIDNVAKRCGDVVLFRHAM